MTRHHLPVIPKEICQLLPISLQSIDRWLLNTSYPTCPGYSPLLDLTYYRTPLGMEGLLHPMRSPGDTAIYMP